MALKMYEKVFQKVECNKEVKPQVTSTFIPTGISTALDSSRKGLLFSFMLITHLLTEIFSMKSNQLMKLSTAINSQQD